jgi:hypothetical protein
MMNKPEPLRLTFQYDEGEAVHGDAALIPVYFVRHVLTRYLYDSRFSCDFVSETYGTVYGPEFYISFGINRSGSVFVWLKDLQNLPVREQFYWLVENKAPEHDIASEFYDGQIEAKFTPPTAVVTCLNAVSKLNAAFHQKFAIHLYHDRSIEERIQETRRYNRLILNNADDFKRFVSELNEIITENTDNTQLRRLIADRGITVAKDAKGNKLLQAIYEALLGDRENLIAPFFYLYDLRLWADHAMGDDKLQQVARNLGVDTHDYQRLMDALARTMEASATKLTTKILEAGR